MPDENKIFKSFEIINDISEVDKNSSVFVLPVNDNEANIIVVDDEGNQKQIKSSGDASSSNFLTVSTNQDVQSSKNFLYSQKIQGYTYSSDVVNDRVTIGTTSYHGSFKKMAVIGESVLPQLTFNQAIYDIDPWFLQRYVAIGTDILKDFKGNVLYNPDHPANDSIVAVGSLLADGFEYGTNLTLLGTGNLVDNDVKQFDSVTAVGKGNVNNKLGLNPNRVVNPISQPSRNIHSSMGQVIMVGHENWFNDIDSSVIIGSATKTYDYAYHAIVIGTENQNYEEDFTKALDHDIIIGNGLNKANSRYKDTHNLIIGSTPGYNTGNSWNASYRPLIEGYMKSDDKPFLGVNGKLEIRNTDLNEIVNHSNNLVSPSSLGSWTGNNEDGYEVAGNITTTLTDSYVPIDGKTYYLKAYPKPGGWTSGTWGISFGSFTDTNSGDYVVEQLIKPTSGSLNALQLQSNSGTGKIFVELYEIYTNQVTDSTLDILDSNENVAIQVRTGLSENESIFIGNHSGEKQVIISKSIALGTKSLGSANLARDVIAIGSESMGASQSAGNSIAIGTKALYQFSGLYTVGIGYEALKSIRACDWNTAVGSLSSTLIEEGVRNVSVGHYSLAALQEGNDNTSIGSSSAFNLKFGNGNTYIGSSTSASSATVSNETVIGASGSGLNTGKGANTVKLGSESTLGTYLYGDIYKDDVLLNSYSSTGIETGSKWVDGSNIYRKVINSGSFTMSSGVSVPHGISNLKDVVSCKVIGKNASGNHKVFHIGLNNTLDYVSSTNIVINNILDSESTLINPYFIIEYTTT